ncbi:MAG: YggS family pyridoxal phosphate-dependent enzyme [Bacteroidetes bacterium]|nr:MAG: YggS family pyridoxal phosphate-dependent enzyme [Bacteroidota bacterium]
MIEEKLQNLLQTIPAGVKVVAVSKTQPVQVIRTAYDAGLRIFGENKVRELVAKHPLLPQDIEWHYIGHLQRNKVKQVVSVAAMIHSIDSFRLLKEVDKEAGKINRTVRCLLQFHIATEETKFGLDWEEAVNMLTSREYREMEFINLCGVMGMATFTDDQALVRKEFRHLRTLYQRLKSDFFPDDPGFSELSMGMSGDYRIAIEEGSTMVRVGTMLFGERE